MFIESLKVERIKIAIANLPFSLEGLKVIQISDFHYEKNSLSTELLVETINKSNRENPDLIFLTGDFITKIPISIYNLIPYLKNLQCKVGIYACLGNHDIHYFSGQKMIIEALKSINIQVLWNQIAYPFGEDLAIVGLADFWSTDFNPASVFELINPLTPRLVLSHNPDTAAILQAYRVDLQLSGHTHGGQIVLPYLGPIPPLVLKLGRYIPSPIRQFIPYLKNCSRIVKHWEWSQGWHRIGLNQLYVNRGLGTYSPGRLFCPPELTVITLYRQ